jgi:hypothetical protein
MPAAEAQETAAPPGQQRVKDGSDTRNQRNVNNRTRRSQEN